MKTNDSTDGHSSIILPQLENHPDDRRSIGKVVAQGSESVWQLDFEQASG
jgi:hypothetical protein